MTQVILPAMALLVKPKPCPMDGEGQGCRTRRRSHLAFPSKVRYSCQLMSSALDVPMYSMDL